MKNERCIRSRCYICSDDILPVHGVSRDSDSIPVAKQVKPVQQGTDYIDSLSDKSLIPF